MPPQSERARSGPTVPFTGRVLTALTTDFLGTPVQGDAAVKPEWAREVHVLDRPRMSGARVLIRLLRTARRYDAIVLDGSIGVRGGYLDQVAAGIIGRMRRGPVVVISDCTWKRGSWWLDRLACRMGIWLADGPKVTYCVLSNDEVAAFPRNWGVDPDRVAFTPWPYTISAEELSLPGADDGGLFAGGDSLRDYPTLIRAARDVAAKVTIGTSTPPRDAAGIPPNVRIRRLHPQAYLEAMRRSLAVVVPLVATEDRSAGQTTYVNAMAMGKPVIATDVLGIRDYVQDGSTGMLVPPRDVGAMHRALRWATDLANRDQLARMGSRARQVARERFHPEGYLQSLVGIARRSLYRVPS